MVNPSGRSKRFQETRRPGIRFRKSADLLSVRAGRIRRGVALLMTLLIVALISASVITFMRAAHLEIKIADNTYSFTQAEIMARAGLRGAMTILAMDDPEVDSLHDMWAKFETYAMMASGFFDEGNITGRIEDLSGRLNINRIVKEDGTVDKMGCGSNYPNDECGHLPHLYELFNTLQLDPDQAVPSLIDWLDKNDDTEPRGAEDQYYMTLEKPYHCANGPLYTLGQLSLIQGWSPEMLYGKDDRPGIMKFLTVHSDEKGNINLNTAPKTVLLTAHPALTESEVQAIIELRMQGPISKYQDLEEILNHIPQWRNILTRLVFKSTHFLISLEAQFREARVAVTAIVERSDSGDVKLIFYRVG